MRYLWTTSLSGSFLGAPSDPAQSGNQLLNGTLIESDDQLSSRILVDCVFLSVVTSSVLLAGAD